MKVCLYSCCLRRELEEKCSASEGGEVRLRPYVSLTWAVSPPNHRSESQEKEEIEKPWAVIHSSCNYSEEVYCICMFPSKTGALPLKW